KEITLESLAINSRGNIATNQLFGSESLVTSLNCHTIDYNEQPSEAMLGNTYYSPIGNTLDLNFEELHQTILPIILLSYN
ncbi:32374_t:CDS:2, partial [Racocetra persica]